MNSDQNKKSTQRCEKKQQHCQLAEKLESALNNQTIGAYQIGPRRAEGARAFFLHLHNFPFIYANAWAATHAAQLSRWLVSLASALTASRVSTSQPSSKNETQRTGGGVRSLAGVKTCRRDAKAFTPSQASLIIGRANIFKHLFLFCVFLCATIHYRRVFYSRV